MRKWLTIIIPLVVCFSVSITSCTKIETQAPDQTKFDSATSTTNPSVGAGTIVAPMPTASPSPTVTPSATTAPLSESNAAGHCPKIVNQLPYEGDILLKSSDQETLTRIAVKGNFQTMDIALGAINGTPYLSQNGDWLYWTEIPIVMVEKGQVSYPAGKKTLYVVNLKTNKKQVVPLPEKWFTALGNGWTPDGRIRLITEEHQDVSSGVLDQRSYAFFDPGSGQLVGEQRDAYKLPDLFYSLQPLDGFAQFNPVTSGVIYSAYQDGPFVRYLDQDRKELWRSPDYDNIFPNFREVWDAAGKNAAYISIPALDNRQGERYFVNLFHLEDLDLSEIEIPPLDQGNTVVSTALDWSPFSSHLIAAFYNQGFQVGDGAHYKAGIAFLINTLNADIEPLCIPDQWYDQGLFINHKEPYMLFTTMDDQKNAAVWLLDIQRWETMKIFEYSFENTRVDLIGAISR